MEESAVAAEAIARVHILRSDPYSQFPYVTFEVNALTHLKGDLPHPEPVLVDVGGPDVEVNGTVGAASGLALGDIALVFLRCEAPVPREGGCWVSDAYILDGGVARSQLNEEEMPAGELTRRIGEALKS